MHLDYLLTGDKNLELILDVQENYSEEPFENFFNFQLLISNCTFIWSGSPTLFQILEKTGVTFKILNILFKHPVILQLTLFLSSNTLQVWLMHIFKNFLWVVSWPPFLLSWKIFSIVVLLIAPTGTVPLSKVWFTDKKQMDTIYADYTRHLLTKVYG